VIGSLGTKPLCSNPLVVSPFHLVATWDGSGGGKRDQIRNGPKTASASKVRSPAKKEKINPFWSPPPPRRSAVDRGRIAEESFRFERRVSPVPLVRLGKPNRQRETGRWRMERCCWSKRSRTRGRQKGGMENVVTWARMRMYSPMKSG